jgi:site-specific DNA recombinase
LARLLADIQTGQVQVVVVYKVDRLSRSLLDFAKMMETFDKHRVSFVAVTQQFNTTTSMGRLVLNVLLSFAQFEREIISERTRDKIAAARRKGKWSGGHPLLGYDVDPRGSKLVVNEAETEQVRAIFALYLEHQGLIPVVRELARRGWVNKRWVTRKGRISGGRGFTKTSLYQVLTNVAYVGKVKHKSDVHAGEHAAIVDEEVWRRVQDTLRQNGAVTGDAVPNRFGAFLKGLLHCASCRCAMTPSHSNRSKTRRYRYYVCTNAQKCGWSVCPSKALPASEIERFVLERIAEFAQNADAWEAALDEAGEGQQPGARNVHDKTVLTQTLSTLPDVWSRLRPDVQGRLIALAVERVDYNGSQGKVVIRFHPTGIVKLAEALIPHDQEARL